jgi:hypothetical protein
MSWQCSCGFEAGDYDVVCSKCGAGRPSRPVPFPAQIAAGQPGSAAVDSAAGSDSAVAQIQSSSPVVNRYRDAYRVGAALVGLGSTIKAVGAILGCIIGVGSVSEASGWIAAAGVFFGAAVGILVWICGVIVAAQGQILLATVDTAVASSHFLTDTERAQAMDLPPNIADRSGA